VVPGATGLIHATPTGMAKLPGLPLDAALLRPDLWVSEIVYFPLETALLQAARALPAAPSATAAAWRWARRWVRSSCSPAARPTRRAWSATFTTC
jgi:hypothetical protein